MKLNRRECLHFIIGADLGQIMQPTALAVVEQRVVDLHPRGGGREVRSMSLRHLERLPLDASYPRIVTRLEELVEALKDQEGDRRRWGKEPSTDVVVNISGTGRAIGEAMEKAGLDPILVNITNGTGETKVEFDDWRLSKNDLVGGLQYLFQNERFRVASGMELAETFVQELQTFKIKPPPLNPNDPESWRSRPDDDLVFAVALATWRARRYLPKPPAQRDREQRKIDASNREMAAFHSMRIDNRRPRIGQIREDGAVLRGFYR